jgi:hypothetical protein
VRLAIYSLSQLDEVQSKEEKIMQLLTKQAMEASQADYKKINKGNDLIFFCDVDSQGKLSCRWIKACLI